MRRIPGYAVGSYYKLGTPLAGLNANPMRGLVYLVTNEYDGTDELGFAWDDPTAAVPWPAVTATPDGRPILSVRDRTNPSLPELVARLRTEA